jgi:uncharacterized repeat protein (TIGR02543 family)
VYGSHLIKPTDPTRTGYTFDYWYTFSSSIPFNFSSESINANITLYAKWTPKVYDVVWEAEGGNFTPSQTTVTHGENITAPTAQPTMAGPNFMGWFYDEAYASPVTFPIANVVGNTTLYAKFDGIEYHVVWNADGGTPAPTQHNVFHGSQIHEPAVMFKTGYTFGGWYRNEGLTTSAIFPIINVTSNITLYAKWTINSYTLTLPSNPVGYTIAAQSGSSSPVNHGGSYSFTVTLSAGYAGTLVVKANGVALTAVGGVYTISNITSAQTITVEGLTSVATRDRVVPVTPESEAVIIAPANQLTAEFTAGPNPVSKSIGTVGFFRQGKSVFGNLTIYDVSGNVVRKIKINDNAIVGAENFQPLLNDPSRRLVGSWDLRDAKGRPVSEGTYLVRGKVETVDGKFEKVSIVVGVR